MRVLAIYVALVLLAACAKQQADSTTTVAAGAERGPCYGNGTCNDGLICLSDLCVRPPPADCAVVARKVGHLTLSNYAPRDERAAFESNMVTECKNAHLTKDEGECITRATRVSELMKCPKPLGLGSCARIVAHIQKNFSSADKDMARFLERGTDKLIEECNKQGITSADEACIMAAKNFDELKACDPGRRR